MVQQASLGSLWSHTTLCLLVAQVHLQANDLSIFLAGGYVEIFDEFAHGTDLLGQGLSCDLDFVKFKLLKLAALVTELSRTLVSSGRIVKCLIASVKLLLIQMLRRRHATQEQA